MDPQVIADASPLRPLVSTTASTLAARGLELFRCDNDLRIHDRIAQLPSNRRDWAFARSRLYRRLHRTEPTDAVMLDGGSVLVNHRNNLWLVDLERGRVALDFAIPKNRFALRLTATDFPTGDGNPVVYFGDYMSNPTKSTASVWRRSPEAGHWGRVFTFAEGQVNHIHDVVPDPYRECFWILAGDFGHAAGIWRATPDWSSVQCVLRGDQRYRAAWLWPRPREVYYATDSQLEPNSLMRLEHDSHGWRALPVAGLPGSSIYGAASGDAYYFSTAVEPGMPEGSRLAVLTDRTPGPGIATTTAHVFRLNSDGQMTMLLEAEKDFWPMRPFQFGTFHMCATEGGAFAYATALKTLDGMTVKVA